MAFGFIQMVLPDCGLLGLNHKRAEEVPVVSDQLCLDKWEQIGHHLWFYLESP